MATEKRKTKKVGRPKGRRYVTIAFSLTSELADAIEKSIAGSGIGKSEFIRNIIKEKLKLGGE